MERSLPGTRALRTFEAAGRHLNFTRASEDLGLTPAAVSFQIKEIEAQLGVPLFTRTSRRIRLTPAGAVMLEAATDALALLQRAAGRARKIARGRAQLHLSLEARFLTNWLLPRLPRFRAAQPELELTFDITERIREFERDDIDVAIRFGQGLVLGARSERLFEAEVIPVCRPGLLGKSRGEVSPRDLFGHRLCHVDCIADTWVWPNWQSWMAAAGVDDFDDRQCLAFPDSNHVLQAVLEGDAIGLLDRALVDGHLADKRLIQLFDLGVAVGPGFAYHLVYPEDSADDPRLRAFREWILAEAAGGPGLPA